MNLEMNTDLCSQLADILGGKAAQEGAVCAVTIHRKNLIVTIANHPMHALDHMFSFENQDKDGNALITGELVLLESEVPKTLDRITTTGIIVGAEHTHWIYDTPKLIYLHIETYTNPITFARMIAPIIGDLK
jgi:hypothetical protein